MAESPLTEAELATYESLAVPLVVHLHPRELLRLVAEVRVLRAARSAHDPRYAHDCKTCVFLGQCGEDDLYFCPAGENNPSGSLVARTSGDGNNFASQSVETMEEQISRWYREIAGRPLTIAYYLAQAKGLIGGSSHD